MQLLDGHQDEVLESHRQRRRFRLLQGEDALSDYQFDGGTTHHLFCNRCSVKSFSSGDIEELGGKIYAVNVACLDDATDEELAQAPVPYENGWNGRWDKALTETRQL